MKMGDTLSVFFLLNNDLDDPTAPRWGGSFVIEEGYPNWWTDNEDEKYKQFQ